jgi:hypothetical protein
MSAETIIVQIDPSQLSQQQKNNYSLYLAKKVNGAFTVIWQSQGPFPTATNPVSYGPNNTFNIAVPSYMVNFSSEKITEGSVTAQASGISQIINTGQTVTLEAGGLFTTPANEGAPGVITINNARQGNPYDVLLDNNGNPIFANSSGMDIGSATLTPIDTYQIWFNSYQDTGTIIANNTSAVGTVTFDGAATTQTISYTSAGTWEPGPLPSTMDLAEGTGPEDSLIIVEVLVTFKFALSLAAATFLLSKFIDKFSSGLRPSSVTTSAGSFKLQVKFDTPKNREILKVFGASKFDEAVLSALSAVKNEKNSVLASETWMVGNTAITVSH